MLETIQRPQGQTLVKDVVKDWHKPKPVKKFQAGAITATIWQNIDAQDPGRVYKTVSFDRNYKDKEGNWKKSNSLRTTDLPKAVIVLKKAYEFLVLRSYSEKTSVNL